MPASIRSFFCAAAILCLTIIACSPDDSRHPDNPVLKLDIEGAKEYNSQTGGVSLIISQKGDILLEDYPNGGHADSSWLLASGTKSFMGIVVAAAIKDGLLKDVNAPVSEMISEWRQDESKSHITVRHLLSLTSGLETQPGGPAPTLSYQESLDLPLIASVGDNYAYGPTPYQSFGAYMQAKLEGSDYDGIADYLQRRVLDSLDIEITNWWVEADNNPRLASGAYMTGKDWLKYGEFILSRGMLNGHSLVDSVAFATMLEGTVANPAYGMGWWINNPVSSELVQEQDSFVQHLMSYTSVGNQLPRDLFFALGGGGQRMYIIPSLELVVVRQQALPPRSNIVEPFDDVAFLKKLLGNQKPLVHSVPQKKEAIDAYLSTITEENQLPFAAFAVIGKDGTLYEGYFNAPSISSTHRIDSTTIWGIRSMTKPITSIAILQLAEKGLIGLDQSVGHYLEAYESMEVLDQIDYRDSTFTTVHTNRQPTIRELLSHTSGITYGLFHPDANALYTKNGGVGGVPDWESLPLMFEPGTQWHYGMGHRLGGWILESITNQSLESYCVTHIFDPLEMDHTRWILSDSQRSQLASVHERNDVGFQPTSWPRAYNENIRGDGGIFATLHDYSTLVQMLLNNGSLNGNQILSPESLREMTHNQIGASTVQRMESVVPWLSNDFPTEPLNHKFGLGVLIHAENESSRASLPRGSYGWDGLFNTYFRVDPSNELGVLFFTQLMPFYDETVRTIIRDLEEILYTDV